MKSTPHTTVLMRLQFLDRSLAEPALAHLGQTLSVDVLRGRITPEEASFELRVTGPERRIQEFIRQGDSWGASVGTSSASVA